MTLPQAIQPFLTHNRRLLGGLKLSQEYLSEIERSIWFTFFVQRHILIHGLFNVEVIIIEVL